MNTNNYTAENMILALKKLAAELGKSPTAVECNNCPYTPNSSTYKNMFGSWNKAKEAAGCLGSNKFGVKSTEELIKGLQEFYNANGRAPTQKECRASNGLYGPNTYKDRFGGWDAAIEAAGLKTNALRSTQISDEELLASLVKFYKEEGRAPRHEDCNNIHAFPYLKSHMVYARRFETFTNALELAGVPLNINYRSVSSLELELLDVIKQIYTGRIVHSARILSKNAPEIDIFLPDLMIGIEFDGLYWHSEDKKDKSYHINKTKDAESRGIRLIHIFENEWIHRREHVINRLKYILKVNKASKIYARKCEIREIESDEANSFLEINHIQGAVNCSVRLGLFYNNNLVAVQTFSKSRFTKSCEWELVRYAGEVVGGASKLFSYFLKTRKPASVVSYSDIRWNTGKLYEVLGFKLSHISEPNYWYYKNQKLESRHKYQKHKLEGLLPKYDVNKSEVENMSDNGYKRIFDCGNKVFIWQNPGHLN